MQPVQPVQPVPVAASIVRLNVGGLPFETTRDTLAASEFFAAAFEAERAFGVAPARLDGQGRLFIDRDGAVFALVLGWLRTGRLFVGGRPAPELLSALEAEADFFGVDSLRGKVVELRAHAVWRAEERARRRNCAAASSPQGNGESPFAISKHGGRRFEPALFTTPIDF